MQTDKALPEPVSPNDTCGMGSKIGQKSVTYYLNGPLTRFNVFLHLERGIRCFLELVQKSVAFSGDAKAFLWTTGSCQ